MTNKDQETTTSGYVDTDQQRPIEEGMQGATGPADANGLNPDVDASAKLDELQQNLGDLAADADTDNK